MSQVHLGNAGCSFGSRLHINQCHVRPDLGWIRTGVRAEHVAFHNAVFRGAAGGANKANKCNAQEGARFMDNGHVFLLQRI